MVGRASRSQAVPGAQGQPRRGAGSRGSVGYGRRARDCPRAGRTPDRRSEVWSRARG
ncbi:MAG: hypothetical protein MZV64_10195 [Ignavibacteriales bacterium]|nr:hypothetical protein [Ignavibacteriales bacterium]